MLGKSLANNGSMYLRRFLSLNNIQTFRHDLKKDMKMTSEMVTLFDFF